LHEKKRGWRQWTLILIFCVNIHMGLDPRPRASTWAWPLPPLCGRHKWMAPNAAVLNLTGWVPGGPRAKATFLFCKGINTQGDQFWQFSRALFSVLVRDWLTKFVSGPRVSKGSERPFCFIYQVINLKSITHLSETGRIKHSLMTWWQLVGCRCSEPCYHILHHHHQYCCCWCNVLQGKTATGWQVNEPLVK